MAICPEHGAYTGDGCRGCLITQGHDIPEGALIKNVRSPIGPPKLEDIDKLNILQLENAVLSLQQEHTQAVAQFQNYMRTMFEKYSVKPAEYALDTKKLAFVTRAM